VSAEPTISTAFSKRLLRIAVGAADSLYGRSLRQKSIDSYKVSKTMTDGLDCIYSGERIDPAGKSLPIDQCLTETLASNKVIRQGSLTQKVMNAAAKPLRARSDRILAKGTANEIVAAINSMAANAKSHAAFKDEVMQFMNMKVASNEVKLAPEALDGLDLFLTVADLSYGPPTCAHQGEKALECGLRVREPNVPDECCEGVSHVFFTRFQYISIYFAV